MSSSLPLRPRLLAATVAATVWGAALLGASSCSGDLGGSSLNGTPPCDGELAGICGASCLVDNDCPAGLHCSNGACSAQCTPVGGQCPAPLACGADGRCSDPSQAGSGAGDGAGGNTFATVGSGGNGQGGGACGAITISFEPQTPTVVVLIDQSGSMNQNFNGQQRWDAVYDALMDPNDGVIKTLEGQVRFGLALYTFSGSNDDPACPTIVDVFPPALNNHAAIDAIYAPEGPEGNTPTGDSINAIVPGLVGVEAPGPKLIILATDGEPDRCEDLDGHDQISRDLATDAAQNAFTQGVETVIIAVGNAVSETHQQDMANAGSGRPVPAADPCDAQSDPVNCAPTYEPTSKQAMIDAFTDIINGKRTCLFDLDGEVIPGKECDGTVTVNGMSIPCNDPDGWQLNSGTQIEFLGSTCETILQDSDVDISAEFPCESVAAPPR